jgi:hypothetical protein
MRGHIKTLAWIHIFHGGVLILVGAGAGIILNAVGAYLNRAGQGADPEFATGPIVGMMGSALALIAMVLAIPKLVAGIGMLKMRPWARMLALVMATLGLIDFPIGTGVGAYTYWVLLSKEGTEAFQRAGDPTDGP